mmetsp:Transcript_6743/g.20409  ORF Transcript_6743/g.20409 Transcript_6743/m.20409 type:complete len:254 (-) Transcript_6743:6118-6879(-)
MGQCRPQWKTVAFARTRRACWSRSRRGHASLSCRCVKARLPRLSRRWLSPTTSWSSSREWHSTAPTPTLNMSLMGVTSHTPTPRLHHRPAVCHEWRAWSFLRRGLTCKSCTRRCACSWHAHARRRIRQPLRLVWTTRPPLRRVRCSATITAFAAGSSRCCCNARWPTCERRLAQPSTPWRACTQPRRRRWRMLTVSASCRHHPTGGFLVHPPFSASLCERCWRCCHLVKRRRHTRSSSLSYCICSSPRALTAS